MGAGQSFFFFFFFFHTDKFIEPHLQYKGNNNTIPTILTKKKLTLHYIAIASYKTYKTIC